MQLLRECMRLWFGLKALALSISLVSFLVTITTWQISAGRLHLVVTIVVVLALDLIAAKAWWTLRKRRPSGRNWALIASASGLGPSILFLIRQPGHYPITVFTGGILGLAGLLAFRARGSALLANDPRRSKKAALAGDGTSKIKDYIAQAISMGIIWMAFQLWNRWAASHGLVRPELISYLLQFNAAVLLSTLFHELGHFAAGWASGKILRMFQVGPFRWAVRSGIWKFEFQLRKFYGGGVAMVAPDLRNFRSRKAFLLLGGPIASLLVGAIFMEVTLITAGHAWETYWVLLSTLATLSIAGFIVNLIPLQQGQYSDGAQLYQIVTDGPWARVHLALAMVGSSAVSPLRPRDFDVNVIHRAADSVPFGERGLLLRLYACLHYLDTNQVSQAIASMQEAEALYQRSSFEKPQGVCAEFVFINAFFKHDLAAAEMWWKRIENLGKIDADADYFRAKTALHWLRGERKEALSAWDRGYDLAQKLPSAGTYDFTRSCYARLRNALDARLRLNQPPLEVAAAHALPMVAAQ